MAYNKKKQLKENILAIQTLLRLQQADRQANDGERSVLSRYSGFGGLKCILRPCGSPEDKSKWPAGEQDLFEDTRLLYRTIDRYIESEDERRAYKSSLQASVLTAFYTPGEVVGAIAGAFRDAGIRADRVLEPSAGTGAFAGAFDSPGKTVVCYEKEPLSAGILSALYPRVITRAAGFETIDEHALGSFDIAVSNIPFGDYRVYDPLYCTGKDETQKRCCKHIHSYFFVKAVDAVRTGGLIAFITSQGVMDSPGNEYVRSYLMEKCDLVSAIRLPCNLFADSAGTQTPGDLIILRKNSAKAERTMRECRFTATRQLGGIHINNYHKDFSRVVQTRAAVGTDRYGKPAINFYYDGEPASLAAAIGEMLAEDLRLYPDMGLYNSRPDKENTKQQKQQPEQVLSLYDLFGIPQEERDGIAKKQKSKATPRPLQSVRPQGQLSGNGKDDTPDDAIPTRMQSMESRPYTGALTDLHKDGALAEDSGQVGILSVKTAWNAKKQCRDEVYTFTPLKATYTQVECLKAYMRLRQAYFQLHRGEAVSRQECPGLRKTLNDRYEEFIAAHGDLGSRENHTLLRQDIFGDEVLTLEYIESGKKKLAGIFEHPVAFMSGEALPVDGADEALVASINRYGRVNMDYMSALSGKQSHALAEELEGRIYYNPLSKEYEPACRLIAGDVIVKSEEIQAYIDAHPGMEDTARSRKSLEALKQAIPKPVPFSDISFSLGERWIPACWYSRYAGGIFGTPVTIEYIADLDSFHIGAENPYTAEIRKKYAVHPGHSNDLCGLTLLSYALVNTCPRITRPSGCFNAAGQEIRIPDVEAMQQAATKIDELRGDFAGYLDNLPIESKEELATLYNRTFNARVKPRYDGSFQTFPDLHLKELGIERPYASQYDTVWMIKMLGGAVVDHEVGTGKTLTICIAAHELKRLNQAHKPMICGLKTNIFAIADTYMKAYPNDNVLYPTEKDFEPANRMKLFHKIKNRDWDVIILTHEQFFRIPQSLEVQRDILRSELNSVEENLKVYERLNNLSASAGMLKGLEKRQANLKAALQDIFGKMEKRRDDAVNFDEMGIDHLFIDESHEFKRLRYDTRYRNVCGLGDPQGSQRALNLLYAIRTMQRRQGKDMCATFLSGTTISNSLVELYLIFKYLRPRALEAQGIRTFDAWAAVYASKTLDYEFTVTNEIKSKERFRYFKNVPELAAMYMEICDYRTARDIDIDRPESNDILHTTRSTPEQEEFSCRLIEFARSGDGALIGRPGVTYDRKDSGRMLVVTDLARKAALDMRLIDPDNYHDHPDGKLSQAARRIADYYYQYQNCRATQFVFCDISTYKTDDPHAWSAYGELKRKLVEEYRIPAHEVRFIQEAVNIRQRAALIAAFKQGVIRVLIGHTKSLGTGVDAPDHCVATHNIDIPWTPKDLEQRRGRGARKGNTVAKLYGGNRVDNIIYASESSLDTYKFNLLQNKQAFITQLKTNSLGKRTFDEGAMDEDGGMNYSEYVAILSGNTDLLDKVKLERRIGILESERKSYYNGQDHAAWSLRYSLEELDGKRSRLSGIEKDRLTVEALLPADADGNRPNPLRLDGDGENVSLQETGERLVALSDGADTAGEYRRVGSLLDFAILVRTHRGENGDTYNRFYVEGACKYTYNNGDLAREPLMAATNFIRALDKIPSLIPKVEAEIVCLEKDIAVMREIVDTPWKKGGELTRLKTELTVLERKIQQALSAIETDDAGEEKKAAPAGKTKAGAVEVIT